MDWYGRALGYSEEEIERAYFAQALLVHQVSDNVPGATYDAISYHRDSAGKLVINGEVTIGDDIFCIEIDPGHNACDIVTNFLKACCNHLGIEASDSIANMMDLITGGVKA